MAQIDNISGNGFYVIAEVGINHNGSLGEAVYLIDAAAKAGAHAVKFQKRCLEAIYTQALLKNANSAEWSFQYLLPQLEALELSEQDYLVLEREAHERGLDFIVTPFDQVSAEFVATLRIDAVKFASADLTNWPLISHALGRIRRPAIFSTGMWDDETIRRSSEFIATLKNDFCLLLCQSTYPAPRNALNLRYLETLKRYAPIVGYSGHERGVDAAMLAYALGATVIEKHITRDPGQLGPDHKASLTPEEFRRLVEGLGAAREMLGANRKEVTQAEILNREVFAKSIVAAVELKPGDVLTPEKVNFLSPGKGIPPHRLSEFVGLPLARGKQPGDYLTVEDFEGGLTVADWPDFSFSKQWGVKCRFHDFDDYRRLDTPVVEFHCSDKDVESDFHEGNAHSALIIHAPEIMGRELFDLCSRDPRVVEASRATLRTTIVKTRSMAPAYAGTEVPKVVVHVGGMSIEDGPLDCSELTHRAESILRDIDLSGVELLPENLPPRPWYLGGEWFQFGFMRPEDMASFCKSLSLGMTFDICHAQLYCRLAGIDLVDYAKIVLPYVRHLHISDAHGVAGEGVQIDEGEIDFDALFRLLEKVPFSWVPEIWSGHINYGAGTLTALKRLEKYGKEAL